MNKNFKRFLSLAVVLVMVFAMFPMNVFAADEETTETGWYDETAAELVIDSVEEYVEFVQLTLQGTTFAGQTVKLGADLDMSEIYIFYNDGTERINNRCDGFAGTFDGDGHTISNMRYFDNVGSETSHVGMAPFRNLSGDIVNLTIDGVDVNVKENVRFYGLVAATKGTSASNRCEISNVTIKNIKVAMNNNTETDRICDANGFLGNMQYTDVANCHVENAEFVILGNASYATTGFVYNLASTSTVENCSVKNLNVQVNGTTGYVGGFAGAVGNQSSITNCTVEGFTAALGGVTTDYGVGGFVGTTTGNWGGNSSTFTKCHVTGMDLTVGTVNAGVGGFAGSNYGGGVNKFIECTVSGKITANNGDGTTGVGGFIGDLGGRSNSTVTTTCESCESNVTVTAGAIPAGGFIGTASASTSTYKTPVGNFTNCTATGDVTSAVAAGGFAGTAKLGTFTECTATGNAVCENGYAAGLIGLNLDEGAVVITDCNPTTEYTGIVEDPVYNLEAVAVIGTTGYPTLNAAVAAANELGTATVTLLKDVTLGEKLTITGNVTIQGAHTITRDDAWTGTLFEVPADASLTLDGGLVIDGGNEWTLSEQYQIDLERDAIGTAWADYVIPEEGAPSATAPMIKVGGSLIAKDVTIQNHLSTNGSNSGAYSVIQLNANASLLTEGAKLHHNATSGANTVAYVSNGATWTINDGTVISDNFAGRNGGISRIDNGTVVMNGGLIEKNGSYNTNGTVFMFFGANALFDMNGGMICGNSGVAGGENGYNAAVYIHQNAKMDMSAGTICHNIGRTCGGIDAPFTADYPEEGKYYTSTVSISGGNVWYNSSARYGEHTNLLRFDMRATITGGWYSSDPSEWVADGYIVVVHEGMGENGVTLYEVTTAVAYNVQDDQYFGDLSDALDVADAGETVQLLKTWYEELVLVPADVTFDLNGNVVKADNVLSFGVVMDNQEDLTKIGGIQIDIDTTKAFTKLQPENGGYLPVYDTDAGMYKFFAYEVQSNAKVGGSNSVTFYTRVVFDNAEGYNVLANTADSGIDFVLTMNWTGMEGFEILYYMTDANVKQYAQMAYDLVNGGNVNNKAMTATVQGVNVLGSGAYISAAPSVKTITEVTGSAEALVYNIP